MFSDGNCFFHAVSHQLFSDTSSQHLVRQAALDQVLSNPELYQDFLVNKDIDTFASTLLEDREWAENYAIQATADAFGVSIEIINSNSERFAPAMVIPQGIPQNLIKSHIVLGHIGQIHFVSTEFIPQGIPQNLIKSHIVLGHIGQIHFVPTEFSPPFPLNSWGGYSKKLRRNLINTCPLDGPLTWLVFLVHVFDKIGELVFHKIKIFRELYDFYKNNESIEAKQIWYQNFAVSFYSNRKDLDLFGSKSEQFFEPLLKTNLGKIIKIEKCNNSNCCREQKSKVALIKKGKNFRGLLSKTILNFLSPKQYTCNSCKGTLMEYVENVPPFLIAPGDVVDYNVNTRDFVEISIQEGIVIYFLVLVTVFEIKSKHFYCYFRLNDRQ